jgi:hypothetical protein
MSIFEAHVPHAKSVGKFHYLAPSVPPWGNAQGNICYRCTLTQTFERVHLTLRIQSGLPEAR